MKKILILFAMAGSGIAIALAVDPGRLLFTDVDAGGHKLRMLICGHGSPTVVFETGGHGATGGTLESWELVQPGVSQFARTVTYDRAGIGNSPPGPPPRDARQIASELHTALQNAHVAPPYVVVGHSFGGLLNRVFAGMYPEEVCGMVLVEPPQEEFVEWAMARDTRHERPPDWKDTMASLAEAHESRVPPGIPVILITGMRLDKLPDAANGNQIEDMKVTKQAWLKFQSAWLEKLPNGKHIITEKSGHMVPFEEPDLVIQAIREVVDKANGYWTAKAR
jgi:pimeloyl-ACP methyl ester carboxylesterase